MFSHFARKPGPRSVQELPDDAHVRFYSMEYLVGHYPYFSDLVEDEGETVFGHPFSG